MSQDIVVILDASGSMVSMENEHIEALNSFIADQKEVNNNGFFTLWQFNGRVFNTIKDQALDEVQEIKNYIPGGMTAIYDAIGNAIGTKLKSANNKNVICVIITDGVENCSSRYTLNDVQELIHEAEKNHDWSFIYLGANHDTFLVSQDLGIKTHAKFDSHTPGSITEVMRSTSTTVQRMRSAV